MCRLFQPFSWYTQAQLVLLHRLRSGRSPAVLPLHGPPEAEARIAWTASLDEIKSFHVTNRASVAIAHLFWDDHAKTIMKIKILNIIPLFFLQLLHVAMFHS